MHNRSEQWGSRWLGGVMLSALLNWQTSALAQPLPPPPTPDLPIPAAPGSPTVEPTITAPAAVPQPSTSSSVSGTSSQVQPGETVFQVVSPNSKITMRALDTRVLEQTNRIRYVEGFDPDKIDPKAMSPYRVRLRALAPGVTTVKLIDEFDNIRNIEVFVEPDTRELSAYLQRLFPSSSIEVVGIRDGVVLRGWVTEPAQIPEIMAVAEQFYEIVQPQLTVAGPSQVQLRVKVMEVQRSKLRELGFNFLMTGQQYYVQNGIAAIAPLSTLSQTGFLPFGGPPTPAISAAALPNSEMQFAITGNSNIFQGFLHALQSESLAKILAEPVLVTTSGRPATVHSGGEFPVLVPQSFGNLSIQWREFGVRLEAVPIVLGQGRVRLDLAPEVSERDFSNSVTINGLVVPGITSRSVNTQVEMRFGETLMIGGLISSRNQGTTQKIPFLGELPWIGVAFSRKSYNVGETELVILVTPQMVAPMAPYQVPQNGPGQGTTVPTDRELYLDGNLEVPSYGPECPDGNCQPGYAPPVTVPPVTAPPMAVPTMTPDMVPSMAPPSLTPQPDPTMIAPLISRKSGTADVGRGTIQQTSGERIVTPNSRTTVVNPFHSISRASAEDASQTKQALAETPANPEKNEPTTATPPVRRIPGKPRHNLFDSTGLPGLIEPKSKENADSAAR